MVAQARQRAPGVDARQEAALGLPDVADPRQIALVEQGVRGPASGLVLAQAAQEALIIELGAEHVRAEPRDAAVEARARVGHQLQLGAVELDDLVVAGAQHEPGPVRRPAPALAAPVDAPAPAQAQVRVERQVAVEADEQVLALRIHGPDAAAAEPLGPAVTAVTRLGSLDLLDLASHERLADAPSGGVDRVALGHQIQTRGASPAAST